MLKTKDLRKKIYRVPELPYPKHLSNRFLDLTLDRQPTLRIEKIVELSDLVAGEMAEASNSEVDLRCQT